MVKSLDGLGSNHMAATYWQVNRMTHLSSLYLSFFGCQMEMLIPGGPASQSRWEMSEVFTMPVCTELVLSHVSPS